MPVERGEELFDARLLRVLHRLSVVARRTLPSGGMGNRRTRRLGRGLDFADHRAYVPGDDLRHLDWNLYARHGRPLVRRFEEESDLALHLLIDASTSMAAGTPSKLTCALRIAGALHHIGLAQQDHVAIDIVRGAELHRVPRQTHAAAGALAALAAVRPGGTTDLNAAARAFVAARPRRGVVVLLSDGFDPRGVHAALSWLAGHGLETVLIALHAEEDADPERSMGALGPTTVVDAETGAEVRLEVTPSLLAAYRAAFAARHAALRSYCRQRGVRSFFISSATPLQDIVLRLLRGELLH